jgi:hypothetical protein
MPSVELMACYQFNFIHFLFTKEVRDSQLWVMPCWQITTENSTAQLPYWA